MKRKFFILIVLASLASLSAFAGNELGNGGDRYAQEFITIGKQLVLKIRAEGDARIDDLGALEKAVEETSISTSDTLSLNGAEVDAINYPEQKKISINRARWQHYNLAEKTSLVLHEYLGVSRQNDENYRISSSYTDVGFNQERPRRFEAQVRTIVSSSFQKYKGEFSYGVYLGYSFKSRYTFGVSANFLNYSDDVESYMYSTKKLTVYSVEVKYKFREAKFTPYIKGAIGYNYQYDEFGYKGLEKSSYGGAAGFSPQFGLGMQYNLFKNMLLDVSANGQGFVNSGSEVSRLYTIITGQAGLSALF